MARPLRIEFAGAVYHVISRGDRREPIFVDDADRQGLLQLVAQALSCFDAEALCYCLMGNHYHFVLHTKQANLSLLMRHINGVYTQYCSVAGPCHETAALNATMADQALARRDRSIPVGAWRDHGMRKANCAF